MDYIIPDGTEISRVQMMLEKNVGFLQSLRFLEKNGTSIMTCGRMIEDPKCLASPECLLEDFNILETRRIVGIKSVSDISKRAVHRDLEFVLMAQKTKTVLLYILANK